MGDISLQKQCHWQLTQCILALSPLVFGSLILCHPTTYGKLHAHHTPSGSTRSSTTAIKGMPPKTQEGSGRNTGVSWGPLLPARPCWAVFESPPIFWAIFGYWNKNPAIFHTSNALLLGAFTIHYVYRSIVYPMTIMSSTSKFPLGLLLFTIPYTIVNGFLQVQGACQFQSYPSQHHVSISFLVGMALMGLGFCMVVTHDMKLCGLRKELSSNASPLLEENGTRTSSLSPSSKPSYTIPYGGMFRYVTAPHFLGEIIEWTGYAIAAQSLAAWSFPIWTAANLVPRALSQHAWYQETFLDTYPKERRAIVPFIM